jgi:hypothetical protein
LGRLASCLAVFIVSTNIVFRLRILETSPDATASCAVKTSPGQFFKYIKSLLCLLKEAALLVCEPTLTGLLVKSFMEIARKNLYKIIT